MTENLAKTFLMRNLSRKRRNSPGANPPYIILNHRALGSWAAALPRDTSHTLPCADADWKGTGSLCGTRRKLQAWQADEAGQPGLSQQSWSKFLGGCSLDAACAFSPDRGTIVLVWSSAFPLLKALPPMSISLNLARCQAHVHTPQTKLPNRKCLRKQLLLSNQTTLS